MIQIPREPQIKEPLSSLWGALVSRCLRAMRPQDSDDISVIEGASGVKFVLRNKPTQQIAADNYTPFQVVMGPVDSDGTMHVGVRSDSHVMDATDDSTHELDNSTWGLLGDDQAADDANWIPVNYTELNIGAKIWLEFKFNSDGDLVSVSLEWGEVNGSLWQYYPDPIEINTADGAYQQYYRVLIAEVVDPDQDPRDGLQLAYQDGTKCQITQITKTNLMLMSAVTASYAQEPNLQIQVAIPWNAPGTKTDGSADPITEEKDVMTPWAFGSVAVTPWHPFLVSAETSDADDPKVSVDSNSDLWKDMGNKFPIAGLDYPFTVRVGDLIWLHIGVADKDHIVPDEASIEHGSSAWTGHPCPITYGNDETTGVKYQQTYEKIIAEVVAENDPREGLVVRGKKNAVKIIQHLKSSLLCTVWAVDGVACLVPEEMQL